MVPPLNDPYTTIMISTYVLWTSLYFLFSNSLEEMGYWFRRLKSIFSNNSYKISKKMYEKQKEERKTKKNEQKNLTVKSSNLTFLSQAISSLYFLKR